MSDQPPYDQSQSPYAPPAPPYAPPQDYRGAQPPAPLYSAPLSKPVTPPQPPYTAPQPPPWEPRPYPYAPEKSRNGLWAGLAAAAVILVSIGAFAYFFVIKDKDPVGTLQPGPKSQTTAPPVPTVTVTLTVPDKLGSRARITDSQHTKVAADTEAALKKDGKVTSVVVAYYGTTDPKKDKIYIVGRAVSAPVSKSAFEAAFANMAKDAGLGEMTGVTDVDPGPLGGYAKCGLIKVEGLPVAACAWADEGSFVTVMWYNRQVTSQVKTELLTIRSQVETKS